MNVTQPTFLGPSYDPLTTSIITTVTSSFSLLVLIILTYVQKRLGVHVKSSHTKLDKLHESIKLMSSSGSQNNDQSHDPENRIWYSLIIPPLKWPDDFLRKPYTNMIIQNPLGKNATTPTTANTYPNPLMTVNQTFPVSGPHPNAAHRYHVHKAVRQYAVRRFRHPNIQSMTGG
jgi:hypothetical protein